MNVNREEKKKVSKTERTKAFWAARVSELLPTIFFSFLGENFFVNSMRKRLSPPTFFFTPPPPLQPNTH